MLFDNFLKVKFDCNIGSLVFMRILFASPSGGIVGGITRWTDHLMAYYNANPPQNIDLVLLPMGRNFFYNINSKNIFLRLKNAFIDYRNIFSEFKKALLQNKFDILHISSSGSLGLFRDYYMASYARRKGLKTVVHFHFGRIPELAKVRNWEWWCLCQVLKKVDRVIVMDRLSLNTLCNLGYKNISMIPNPLSLSVENIITSNANIIRKPKTILFAGHVIETKGIIELVEACRNISDIQLRILGRISSEMTELLKQKSNNAPWLQIEGEKEHSYVIKSMLESDIFVLPSYTEGFPNVILEAMACGCVIVASSVGAIPEIIADSCKHPCGVLVAPHSSFEIEASINRILVDKSFKEKLRVNAIRKVYSKYRIEKVWNEILKMWTNVYSM